MSATPDATPNTWAKAIPWFLTISSVLALIAIGVFLVLNIEWYKNTVLDNGIIDKDWGVYRVTVYELFLSMIKRSVGLFSGFAIMFLGLGVAFYTIQSNTEIGASLKDIKFNLLTASPGIVAIVVGGLLIILTIQSKDSFEPYTAKYPPSLLQPDKKGALDDTARIRPIPKESNDAQPDTIFTNHTNH